MIFVSRGGLSGMDRTEKMGCRVGGEIVSWLDELYRIAFSKMS